MDKFEKRLKKDAAVIQADVSPELRDRIRASVHSAGQVGPESGQRTTTSNLWWASSLTGLAAAAMVIVLFNWTRPDASTTDRVPEATTATVPDFREYMDELDTALPLRTDTVEFANGLEDELARLQADIEKAKERVSRDVDFTF